MASRKRITVKIYFATYEDSVREFMNSYRDCDKEYKVERSMFKDWLQSRMATLCEEIKSDIDVNAVVLLLLDKRRLILGGKYWAGVILEDLN